MLEYIFQKDHWPLFKKENGEISYLNDFPTPIWLPYNGIIYDTIDLNEYLDKIYDVGVSKEYADIVKTIYLQHKKDEFYQDILEE